MKLVVRLLSFDRHGVAAAMLATGAANTALVPGHW